MRDDTPVTLQPARPTVVAWTLVGGAAVALSAWVAVDARSSLLAWLFLALCLVVASYVLAQLLLPSRFRIVLDPAAIEVALPWQHERLTWDRVHLARVVRVTGEPVLELHVWDPDDVAEEPRALGVLLPIGADVTALHRVLERRLGRHDPAAADGRSQSA